MNTRSMSHTLLSMALATLLAAPGMANATPAGTQATHQQALAQARAELQRAAARVAELSRGQPAQHAASRVQMRHVSDRPVLGVVLGADGQPGVRISGVTPDGAAAKAGLRGGDRLVSINGSQILGATGQLRVDNARKLLGGTAMERPVKLGYLRDGRAASLDVTPSRHPGLMVFGNDVDGTVKMDNGRIVINRSVGAPVSIDMDALTGITPEIQQEISRINSGEVPRLLSAFRWNGLNLASVDRQLGRYFGTDKGVLVLSTGELDGLQAGDVILRADGRTVGTPKEVMDVLRDKQEGSRVAVDYLRDRKQGQARVAVPKAMTWPPMPPAPPAAPAPPATPKAPPAPPAPPRAPSSMAPAVPPAPPAPPLPPPAIA